MTLGHKLKTALGREPWAINEKEMSLGHKLKTTIGRELWALNGN